MRSWILIGGGRRGAHAARKPAPPKNEFEAFERKYVEENELLVEGSA